MHADDAIGLRVPVRGTIKHLDSKELLLNWMRDSRQGGFHQTAQEPGEFNGTLEAVRSQ